MTNRYELGFSVDGTPVPDPTKFTASESALDTSAERDADGMLHRAMVATKVHCSITFTNFPWSTIQNILGLVRGESFSFAFPDPTTGGVNTRTCYAGDRQIEITRAYEGLERLGNLTFNIIEY
jgi:hypothetical protein